MVNNNEWDKLLRKVNIKGDFFYVPSGTIHAICKGTLILETQQNSDTTYRVYDYDRTDNSGNKRELHIQKSIDVTNVPHINFDTDYKIVSTSDFKCTTFVSNEFLVFIN